MYEVAMLKVPAQIVSVEATFPSRALGYVEAYVTTSSCKATYSFFSVLCGREQ